ncbi:MAG: DNA-directed DNA polymerase [Candidatus Altiarchaeota archaeon]
MKCLLDADYVTVNEKAVVRLFYKTEKGREIEEVKNFEPYFYAIPKEGKTSELFEEVKKLPNVVKVEKKRMIDLCNEIEVLSITVKQPKNVPELREVIKNSENCKEIREADIPFSERYIINSELIPMENAEKINLRIAAFDLEVYNPKGEPHSDRDPILMISYADNLGMKKVFTYKHNSELEFVETLKDEAEIIKKFIEMVKKQEIDIIISYNGDNFDFPYLKERAGKYKIQLDLGIDNSEVKLERRGMNLGARVKGRPHIDLFPICRQIFNLSRYTLEDVYLEIFGEEKIDIQTGEMHRFWDSNNKEFIKKIFEYSMSDAISTLKIALVVLPLQYELSRITRDLIYESSRSSASQRVEALLIRRAFEKNILVPNKPPDRVAEERQRSSYVGAYVVEPKKGIHNSIVLFDFRSLYPSIIISYNIDPSTLDCNCCIGKEKQGKYHFCKNKKGFIPEILRELIDRRIEVKRKLKEEIDIERKKFLNVEQQALKILANSMYGYYAFARARWYSKECAEIIAALGREYIHRTINEAKKFGFDVLYGDTDSVYLTKHSEKEKEKILNDAFTFLKKINSELPEAMELEFDGFYPRGIFITKKRYALIDEKGNLIVKGLETRRRDWANVAKETQNKVLMALLKDNDPKKAAEIVKETVKRIKDGKISLKDLAINTQITRNMAEYVQDGPHIVAAKKAMKQGFEFRQGDIITYIITKKGSSISDKAKIIDFVEEGDYDADYYINNQVLPAVFRILESLGYSEDELKGLGKQITLGSF